MFVSLIALCPDPTAPANGGVTFTGSTIGDTATYSCNNGFELVGNALTTCVELNQNSSLFFSSPFCLGNIKL